MNTTRRDGADDTGEQDVRGLRRHFLGGNGAHQEMPKEADAPRIPDFYGLEDPFEDTAEGQIEAVLLKMVDEGELCFGWIEERQEMGFWRCDDVESSSSSRCPAPEPEPQKKVSHRRTRATRHRVMSRTVVTVVAAVATPFAVGVTAYAVGHTREPHKLTVAQPDLTSDESPPQAPAPAPKVVKAPAPKVVKASAPNITPSFDISRGGIPEARHRKKPDHPQHKHHHDHQAEGHEGDEGHHYRGRHRKDTDTSAPSTDPERGLVGQVFHPVESLLGRTFR
jgi:hypothetical protein